MANLENLSVEQLRKAVVIKEQIAQLQSELNSLFDGDGALPARDGRRRPMSASARARIAAAQRARWARVKGHGDGETAAVAQEKPKRYVSPATRARLAALVKARWAKAKAAGQASL
jgi:hypothetical protein